MIAAVKANRTICPTGIRMSMSDFAANLIETSVEQSVIFNERVRVQ
ncbi:hypothetical protein J2T13_004843 [Paenibacillus sp. DS2015]